MADKKYLDLGGVTKLWQLIKSKIPSTYASSQSAGGAADKAVSIPFGQVDGTSTATVFTATVDGITELRDGVCVYLKNGVITSASGFTLNINGLGAKPCYSTLAAASRSTTLFNVNYTMLFVYNSSRVEGGCWDIFYGYDSNTNTIGYQLRTYSTTLPMTQKVYRYRLLFTSADGTHWVPANTSTSTNATAVRTVNQTKINPFGKIVYYGYTAAIDAGASPGTSYMWTQNVVTLGYSFNSTGAALVLDAFKPIYLKCAPQSDGSAIIDADNPYVQTLPSAADGKIYIFLGIAVTATTVELIPEHPIYCYRNGGIQLWTGAQNDIFSVTYTLTSSMTATCDKTYAEVAEAIQANKTIDGSVVSSNVVVGKTTNPLLDSEGIKYGYTYINNNTLNVISLTHSSSDVITLTFKELYDPLYGDMDNTSASNYVSPGDAITALSLGRDVILTHTDNLYGTMTFYSWYVNTTLSVVVSSITVNLGGIPATYIAQGGDGWEFYTAAIPQNTSELLNDSGFITLSDISVPDELADLSDDSTHRLVTDTEKSTWNAKANAPRYTTLTLAVNDWQSSGNVYSCSKTVTGMTATSIVWLSYSDTATVFTETQSANTLTFTVSNPPNVAITVKVAFMEGSAL